MSWTPGGSRPVGLLSHDGHGVVTPWNRVWQPMRQLFAPRHIGDTQHMFTVAIGLCCVVLMGRGIVEGVGARHVAFFPSAAHPNNNVVFLLAVPVFLATLEYLSSHTSRAQSVLFRPFSAAGLLVFTCVSNIASNDTTIAGNLFYLLPSVVGAYAWRTPAVMAMTALSVTCCAFQSFLLLPSTEAVEWVLLMASLCFTSGVVFSTAGRQRESLLKTLESATVTDALTGLRTRSVLADAVEELYTMEEDFSLLVIDIDFFKEINDTAGHPAGDEALKVVSKVLLENLDDFDIAARWGGDEFAVLLRGAAHDKALEWAEVVRRGVSAHVVVSGDTSTALTLSIGVATARADGDSAESLFHAADQAMYQAKRAGRNTACDSECGAAENPCGPSKAARC